MAPREEGGGVGILVAPLLFLIKLSLYLSVLPDRAFYFTSSHLLISNKLLSLSVYIHFSCSLHSYLLSAFTNLSLHRHFFLSAFTDLSCPRLPSHSSA